jgi:LysR substrate binding domain-containing protein
VRLRIGYSAAALPASFPRALQALRASAARTESTLRPGWALELVEAVRDGRLDVAVVPLPVPASGLRITELGDQHAVAALPSEDPRSRAPSIALARVAPERLLLLPRESNRPFHDGVIAACRAAGLAPTIVELPADEIEQTLLAVASSDGMALLPESVADRYTTPGVRFVALDDPRPAFTAGVVTRRDDDHVPTASFLWALSKAALACRRERAARRPAAVA